MNGLRYLGKRLVLACITLLGVTVLTFAGVHLAPGDPIQIALESQAQSTGTSPTEEDENRLRERWGLDRPVIVQYTSWLLHALKGDLGHSLRDNHAVSEKIAERMPWTLQLTLCAWCVSLIVALPFGAWVAYRGTRLGKLLSYVMLWLYALPPFALALGALMVFSIQLDWFPLYGVQSIDAAEPRSLASFLDRVHHLVLPVLTLAAGTMAYYARFVSQTLSRSMGEPFVLAVRSRGVSESRLFFVHILRHASVPFITLGAMIVPTLLSGSVVLEMIFSWPGVGSLMLEAVHAHDYYLLMGLTLWSSVAVLISFLIGDLLCALLDPRTSHASA